MLDEIRQKSPPVKKAYAFWGALTITALIAAVWSVSLPVRLRAISTFSLEPRSTSQAAGSAFSRFFDDLWGGSGKEAADETDKEAAPGPAAADTAPDASTEPAAAGAPANPPAILIAPTSSRPAATTTKPAIQIATSSAAEE